MMSDYSYGLMCVKSDGKTKYSIDAEWVTGVRYKNLDPCNIQVWDDERNTLYPVDEETLFPFVSAFHSKMRPFFYVEQNQLTVQLVGCFFEEGTEDTMIDIEMVGRCEVVFAAVDDDAKSHEYKFEMWGEQLILTMC